ncbi:MFS transporter [Granulicella sp. 5B5]|uniref:MFS transporter n=1 Tax=Granulicella sp. 5B5 TaxID=1617967 RepID=UPI0015F44B1B|nr:MFS transporter [Granulicella sp. 5B5]QMV18572.1 MFS transporter [Granulicella sp. 5B5]
MSSVAAITTTNTAQLPASNQARGLRPYTHVLAVFLCGAIAFLELYCVQPLLPLLSHIFGVTETHVGLTISASTLGVAISAALLAIFGERLDRKRTIVLAMTALGLSGLLTSTAIGLYSLTAWRFLQGIVTPGIFIITIAYVTEEWPAHLVPRVMSAYVAGTVFGGFSGRLLGGLIADHLGWRPVFFILGAIGLVGALLTHRLLPAAHASTHSHKHHKPASPYAPLLANLRNPRLLATFGIGFCMLFTLISVFSFITFYLSDAPFHLGTTALSYLFAVYLIGLVATLAAGTVLARIGLRHGMVFAVLLCITGVALTLIHALAFVALGLAVCSSGVFIAQTCANSFLRDAAPAGSRVSAAGLYICGYYIGGTVGGVLPGLAYRYAGWPATAALTIAILAIAGLTAWFGWPAHRSDPIPL